MEKHVNKFLAVWALALTAFVLMGVSIPHTFQPGTTINSGEVNANFMALRDAVTALEGRSASRGNIVGLAHVRADGTIEAGSWMASGSTPTLVTHVLASGRYVIGFPGENVSINTRTILANTTGMGSGWASVGSNAGNAVVYTYDTLGNAADDAFWVMILND